jgi:hypothetical protein
MKAGNSALGKLHIPSNAGPGSGSFCMVDVVIDGRQGSNGGARYFADASLNGNNGTGCYRMLVTGKNADVNATGLHVESRGDGVFVDDLGGGSFWDTSSTVPITFASVHGSSTADLWCGYVGKQGDTHPAFQDDLNNITVTPGQGLGAQYCNRHYFAQVHANYVFGDQEGCTNGEVVLSPGWGNTATINAHHGKGQTCQWTITSSGTGTGANPTVTDTLVSGLTTANADMVCTMTMTGGTGTQTAFQQTTFSATVPVFTFQGTPAGGGATYIVVRRCGP